MASAGRKERPARQKYERFHRLLRAAVAIAKHLQLAVELVFIKEKLN